MNIGIIVYSETGNTYSVAQKIKDSISDSGHNIVVKKLETIEKNKKKKDYNLKEYPDLSKYDLLIFASYVEAFSLSLAMQNYFKDIESLNGKKVFCFVTKALFFNWTGGNRAIRQMKRMCKSKGASILGSGIVKWRDKDRENDIFALLEKVSNIIT